MGLSNLIDSPASSAQVFASNGNTTSQKIVGNKTLACQVVVTVSTPANKTWTSGNVSGNSITITAHGYTTGLAVTLTTSGTLPTGLATSTTYYLIVVDANTIQFATSLANALAGTAITLSSSGSGTGTVNVTALAGGSVKLQKSVDGVTWFDEGTSQSVTASGSFYFEKVDPTGKYYSILVALTAGQLTVTNQYFCKGIVT